MRRPILTLLTLLAAAGGALSACGGPPPAPAPEPPPPASEAAPAAPAALPRTPAPTGASVSITRPANGTVVSSPVTIEFTIEGMALAPAGSYEPDTGHHHVLVDVDLPPLDQPIPNDANHIHFGKAQTQGEIQLEPGEHRLQLLLGDGNHVPHDPPVVSEPVTITVQ
jgi:hypothetical protein